MSLLDKIKQEYQSPTVKIAPRQDELIPTPETVKSREKEEKREEQEMIASLEQELQSFPPITPKKMGVRLEESIYEQIRSLCREEDITLETLVEAYFTICQGNPLLQQQIIEEAQKRVKQRTKAGNIRSLLTKARNLQRRG